MHDYTTANAGTFLLQRALMSPKRPKRKRRYLLWLALTLGALTPLASRAEVATDSAAHFGVSYALAMGSYGLFKTISTRDCRLQLADAPPSCPLTPNERFHAALFAAVTSFAIGAVKEMGDRQVDGRDLLYNGLGSVGAMGTILLFEF